MKNIMQGSRQRLVTALTLAIQDILQNKVSLVIMDSSEDHLNRPYTVFPEAIIHTSSLASMYEIVLCPRETWW